MATIKVKPKSKRFKRKTRIKGFNRKVRKLSKKSKRKFSRKSVTIVIARDRFGQFAGSRRK